MIKSPNYAFQSVSDKGKTQATLHSRYARVGEYKFNHSLRSSQFPFQNSKEIKMKIILYIIKNAFLFLGIASIIYKSILYAIACVILYTIFEMVCKMEDKE